jgi:hypothetical protein
MPFLLLAAMTALMGMGPAVPAAAHAELGQFDLALRRQTEAIGSAGAEKKGPYRERLQRYQECKPYRLE